MRPRHKLSTLPFSACLVVLTIAGSAAATTLDFEGFADSTIVTTQYLGLTFSNTIILTAGISLDEIDFPPHSGANVASDNNGPITIDFATPITTFSGYFTYTEPLTLNAFDVTSTEVASATSLFSENFVSSGNPANELITVAFAGGFSSVTITGDPSGGSFTMDDLTYAAGTSTVPEGPFTLLLFAMTAILVCLHALKYDY
jgi:hypothetical protein